MRAAVFGGAFDPVHTQHKLFAKAAIGALGLERVFLVPSNLAPHKSAACASGEDRMEMLRLAFADLPVCEPCDFELRAGGKSFSYLTCQAFRARFPEDELYFLMGADMLRTFEEWRNPDEIVRCVNVAACGRGGALTEADRAAFRTRFHAELTEIPFVGEEVSSTQIKVDLAFGKPPALDGAVLRYIHERGLYAQPAVLPALALEKEERREHSYRVACMAAARARSAGVSEEKALLAAALHDCAKSVPTDSPLLKGAVPTDVPAPVVHQYGGAVLAANLFGVRDEEVLDAIRYHASGREDMTALGKLIYLADLLEEGRSFPHIWELRALFWRDLDACMLAALGHQLDYLRKKGQPVYPLTERAYQWLKAHQTA